MMLQNYTYVDPMMDPLLLLAVMLGVVLVVAGGLALVLSRTSGSSASSTSEEPATDQTPFVAPETYQPGGVPDVPRSDNGDWDDSVVHQTMRSAQDRSRRTPPRSSSLSERQTA